jgi:L-arabinose isomerase
MEDMSVWKAKPNVGLVVAYAPLEVGWDISSALLDEARKTFAALPLEVHAAPEPVSDPATALAAAEGLSRANIEAVVWLAATWSFDSTALEFLRACPVPLLAWGLPGMETGSLCGSQQLVSVLRELGRPCGFVHGALDDPAAHAAVLDFARASAAARRLSKARFGMLGHRTAGMTEVTFQEYDLFEQFGALVYYKGIDRLRDEMNAVPEADAAKLWREVKGRCGRCNVEDACGITAMRCYRALRDWVNPGSAGLGGIAVGCYPDLMGIVCLACGLLAEEGIATSCEGDINSLVLTAAMQVMSGRPIHNTDLLFADAKENTCTFSHCGNSAISLAERKEDIRLEHVRLMDQGVVSLYPGAPGRVTLANLCGRKGSYRLACYTGEAVPTEMVFPGIPVKVRLDVPVEAFLRDTALFGAGHHWMIACGDISAALSGFARLTHLKTLGLDENEVQIRQ